MNGMIRNNLPYHLIYILAEIEAISCETCQAAISAGGRIQNIAEHMRQTSGQCNIVNMENWQRIRRSSLPYEELESEVWTTPCLITYQQSRR
jgi:hypothetical protein